MWKNFNDERPKGPAPFGFLVIPAGCTYPVMAQFDSVSRRFMMYYAPIGKAIQVPVTMWFEIPVPSNIQSKTAL